MNNEGDTDMAKRFEIKTKLLEKTIAKTLFKGHVFDTRLEARWAVFFDHCGVVWRYKPGAYRLSNGEVYTPTFMLCDVDCRGNVNGKLFVAVVRELTYQDAENITRFHDDSHLSSTLNEEEAPPTQKRVCVWTPEGIDTGNPILVVSHIPEGDSSGALLNYCASFGANNAYDGFRKSHPSWYGRADFAGERDGYVYPYPYNFATVDNDYFPAMPSVRPDGRFYLCGHDCNYLCEVDDKITVAAYDAARQARFDHGVVDRKTEE